MDFPSIGLPDFFKTKKGAVSRPFYFQGYFLIYYLFHRLDFTSKHLASYIQFID